jgi:16S rRNA (guanine966-N2)-methyltransferase
MKITGGILRGRNVALRNHKSVRPTSSRVREALFSTLGQNFEGRSFLDAFGGSGIMGLEAYSRGATTTIFEQSPKTAAVIKDTIRKLKINIKGQIVDVEKGVRRRLWDDIFLDPPYNENPQIWVKKISPHSNERLIIEYHQRWETPRLDAEWQVKTKKFGETMLAIYTKG